MKSKKRSRRWPKFTQNYSTSPNKTIFQIDSIQTDLFDQVLEVPLKRARNNDKLNLIERSGGLLCQVYCRLQMHLVTAAETADQLKDLTKLCESKPGCNRFFALPLSRLYSYSNLKWSVLTSLQLSGGATSYHQPVYLISHSGYQLLTPPVSSSKPPSCFKQEMFLLLLLPLLCTEAVNVQDSFAEAGLVKDLKILAPDKQLEVMRTSVRWQHILWIVR